MRFGALEWFVLVLIGACWALILEGCSRTNLAEVIKAMANDPATACFREEGLAPYIAPVSYYRTNIQNGSVKCNSDGLVVTSDGVKP